MKGEAFSEETNFYLLRRIGKKAKKHKNFYETCLDTMDYDDNFDVDGESSSNNQDRKTQWDITSNSSATSVNLEKITKIVLRKMGNMYHSSYKLQQKYARPTPIGCIN